MDLLDQRMESNITKFQRQIELSQETDMLRYQVHMKEQENINHSNSILNDPSQKVIQDYCKPLFETIKAMMAQCSKQVFALNDQVKEINME
jgi:hypothetical protein